MIDGPTNNTFMGMRVIVNRLCDIYDRVPVRPHKKKRLRKKFLKKYGMKEKLVSSEAYITKGNDLIIGPSMYDVLTKQAIEYSITIGAH